MDFSLQSIEQEGLQLSASPAGSPKITDPDSPVHSIHAEAMDGDEEHATNFFDDASTDDGETPLTGTADATPETASQQRAKARYSADSQTVPLHLSTPVGDCGHRHAPPRPQRPPGSLDPADFQITPKIKMVRQADWRGSPRRYSVPLDAMSGLAKQQPPDGSSRQEDILSAHAITLEAILRSEGEPRTAAARPKRISIAPPPIEAAAADAPPRIKQTLARSAAPYPIGIRKSFRQSHVSFNGVGAAPPPREAILALTLRRRAGRRSARVGEVRIPASLDVVVSAPSTPAAAAPAAAASSTGTAAGGKDAGTGAGATAPPPPTPPSPRDPKKRSERHFETLDFDDAYLFRALRAGYARLAGPLRRLSARGLRAIEVARSPPAPAAAAEGRRRARTASPRPPARPAAGGPSGPALGARAAGRVPRPRPPRARAVRVGALGAPHRERAAAPGARRGGGAAARSRRRGGGGGAGGGRWRGRRGAGGRAARARAPAKPPAPSCVAGLEFVEGWAAARISAAVLAVARARRRGRAAVGLRRVLARGARGRVPRRRGARRRRVPRRHVRAAAGAGGRGALGAGVLAGRLIVALGSRLVFILRR